MTFPPYVPLEPRSPHTRGSRESVVEPRWVQQDLGHAMRDNGPLRAVHFESCPLRAVHFESGPRRAVHLSRQKWPTLNAGARAGLLFAPPSTPCDSLFAAAPAEGD
jgi:hypothetical protein